MSLFVIASIIVAIFIVLVILGVLRGLVSNVFGSGLIGTVVFILVLIAIWHWLL